MSKGLRKQDIVNSISDQTGIERKITKNIVECFMLEVKNQMRGGNNIYLRGFGTFKVIKRKEKIARKNFRDSGGTSIIVPSHYSPVFKPSKIFKNKIKNTLTA